MLRLNFLSVFIILSIISCNIKTISVSKDYKINQTKIINQLLDDWHKAAANADLDNYFNKMTDDAIYLGTDASERWTKDEFCKFCKPYFDKGKAWDFKPLNRQVYFSEDMKTAWFEEILDTWMGKCRGSGILVYQKPNWKIKHYNLAVAVPNNLIEDYIKLLKDK